MTSSPPDLGLARQRIVACATAGLVSGLLVLGVGGRVLMRLLAFTTPEAPRFTWVGTLQIVALGAVWGLLTGPLILVAAGRLRSGRAVGPTFGLFVFVLAAVPFALYSGFGGRLVAPALFLWLGAVTFPALFIVHGMAVSAMHRRGSLPEPADVRARAGPYRRRPSSTSGTSGERGG